MTSPPTPKRRAPRRKAQGDPQESVSSVPPVTDTPFEAPSPSEDAPPRGRAKGGTDGTTPPASRPGRKPQLQAALEDLLAVPAMAYTFTGDEWAAQLFTTRSERLAEAWYDLAQKNPAVKRVLTRLVEGSAWGGVIGSSAAILVPLAQHHGLLPGSDPFAAFYPPLPDEGGRVVPIVPPPPPPPSSPVGRPGDGPSPPGPGRTDAVPGTVVVGPPVPANGSARP